MEPAPAQPLEDAIPMIVGDAPSDPAARCRHLDMLTGQIIGKAARGDFDFESLKLI